MYFFRDSVVRGDSGVPRVQLPVPDRRACSRSCNPTIPTVRVHIVEASWSVVEPSVEGAPGELRFSPTLSFL